MTHHILPPAKTFQLCMRAWISVDAERQEKINVRGQRRASGDADLAELASPHTHCILWELNSEWSRSASLAQRRYRAQAKSCIPVVF